MNISQFADIPENDEVAGLDKVVVPSPLIEGAEKRSLLRTTSGPVTRFVAGTLAALAAADNNDMYAAEPVNSLVAMSPSSTLGGVDSDVSMSKTDVERWKNQIVNERLKIAYSNIEKTTGAEQNTKRIELLQRLKACLKNSMSEAETRAINELIYKEAKLCGSFNDALDFHYKISNDLDLLKPEYLQEELDLLKAASSAVVNQFASKQSAINAAIKERVEVLSAIETLKKNPSDESAHSVLGLFLSFGRYASETGYPHLAQGTDPVARELFHPDNLNNSEIWAAGAQKVRPEWKKFVADRAAKLKQVEGAFAPVPNTGEAGSTRVTVDPQIAAAPVQNSPSAIAPDVKLKPITGREFNALNPQIVNLNKYLKWGKLSYEQGGVLLANPVERGTSKLLFPVIPTGNHRIQVEMEIVGTGEKNVTIVIPAGGTEFFITRLSKFVSIEQSDGSGKKKYPNQVPVDENDTKISYLVDVYVNADGTYTVYPTLNGKKLEPFTVTKNPIGKDGTWALDQESFGAVTYGTNVFFRKVTATAVNGKLVPPVNK